MDYLFNSQKPFTNTNPNTHNRLVVGSNPTEPTFEASFPQNAADSFKKSHVLPELLQLRELLHILLGSKGRRQLELRQKTNQELFALYEGELAFHHRSARGLHESKRVLKHFHDYLGEYPPTPELAKSFLSPFSDRKPTTLARYAAIINLLENTKYLRLRIPSCFHDYLLYLFYRRLALKVDLFSGDRPVWPVSLSRDNVRVK